MRVLFAQSWIAQSDDVVLLHEPGRYPVAYFPKADIDAELLNLSGRTTQHTELSPTDWYAVKLGDHEAARGAWEHSQLPSFADILSDRVAFAWHAMDAFYEEDERIVGHAADPYHRIDIRQTSRELTVHTGETLIASSHRPLVLYESGFAPRWYLPREDVTDAPLAPLEQQAFCPYKGLCGYYDVNGIARAAWSYRDPYTEVQRIGDFISFEPDKVRVMIDGNRLRPAPGQHVVSHGPDRGLTPDEVTRPLPADQTSTASS